MLKYTCLLESKLNSEYLEQVNWLFQQFPSYQVMGSKAFKPTLKNTSKIVQLLGNPEQKLQFVHVAGSNGKGSTCSLIASALTESGYKVGLFTSPHIKDFTERIRINGNEINKAFVISFIHKIKSLELDFEPSFFEITLGMALDYFHQQTCDICVIETGLGGRFDATNIIQPILSIITNISLEHTEMLGNTLNEIAKEKAGIIKKKTPVVIGETEATLYPLFAQIAQENQSPCYYAKNNILFTEFSSPLLGPHQIENLKTTLTAIDVLNSIGLKIETGHITQGLKNLTVNTGFYGRLQVVNEKPLTLFDVSHNPAGIKASLKVVQEQNKGKLHIVYGTSADKDLKMILNVLPDHANYYFTEFKNPRSILIDDLKSIIPDKMKNKSLFFSSSKEAFKSAQNNANHRDTILVIGSFFLISDFF